MSKAVEYLNPPGACPAQGLYSHIGKVSEGSLLFVAGQLSVAVDGSVAGVGDLDVQFEQVFDNLQAVLTGVGCDFNDVVKFTTYLVHSQDIDRFMRLRAARFPNLFATSAGHAARRRPSGQGELPDRGRGHRQGTLRCRAGEGPLARKSRSVGSFL